MGQFSAFLFSSCLPLFLFTSLTWRPWIVLAVVLTLQYFLPLGLGSCCSSPVYEVFQILLIHCCLHEYYRILLFSSNLSLSLFLNILNIYLLCMCMNVYWHMRAWSPQYVCGGHFQSLFTPSILWMPRMDELRSTGIFIMSCLIGHFTLIFSVALVSPLKIFALFIVFFVFCLFVLLYVISSAFSVWPSQVYTKSHTVHINCLLTADHFCASGH